MAENEFSWQTDGSWSVPDNDAEQRCVEMLVKSLQWRRIEARGDKRVQPPTHEMYTAEFYYVTAARFFALACSKKN